jgi:hypothetical protein
MVAPFHLILLELAVSREHGRHLRRGLLAWRAFLRHSKLRSPLPIDHMSRVMAHYDLKGFEAVLAATAVHSHTLRRCSIKCV